MSEKKQKTFSEIVREIADEQEINVTEIAKHAGITKSTIYEWMEGARLPQKKIFQKFIDTYHLDDAEAWDAMFESHRLYRTGRTRGVGI